MTKIDNAHLVWGILFLGVFLATGGYMKTGFPGLYHGDDAVRMLYRSAHIYILFSALLNLAHAAGGNKLDRSLRGWIQGVSSVALMGSSVLFLLCFLNETARMELQRPFAFWGVVSTLSATILKLGVRLSIPNTRH